jgi:hypothetical protein
MSNGKTYVILYRPVMDSYYNDVVVYRRDATEFDALKDQGQVLQAASDLPSKCTEPANSGRTGKRVMRCLAYGWPRVGNEHFKDFGQERRLATELAIAVHPTDWRKVFISWAQRSPIDSNIISLHFAHSNDGGETWERWNDAFKVDSATNPALAVASDGTVGVLYEHLVDSSHTLFWNTEFVLSTDDLKTVSGPHLLAHVDATNPKVQAEPYLGDYIRLESVGKNFYGVFPASNDKPAQSFPDLCPSSLCPNQRLYDQHGHPKDKNGNGVSPSIDPYFFRVIR